jgi:hypothetical protein
MADSFKGVDSAVEGIATGNAVRVLALPGSLDSGGGIIAPDNYAHVFTYNGDGTVLTDAFTDGVSTWTQTFTYADGRLTAISKWVKS